jgi:adenylate cyclase, class 2
MDPDRYGMVTADGRDGSGPARGGVLREVEVKYRIRDLDALTTALHMRGIELRDPFLQDDQAYAPDGWAYGDDRSGVPFARLRTVEGRHVFTLKRPAENVLSCEEHVGRHSV